MDTHDIGYHIDTNRGSQYLTIRAAAKTLGVSRQTLYRWIQSGHIPKPTLRRSRDGTLLLDAECFSAAQDFAFGVVPTQGGESK